MNKFATVISFAAMAASAQAAIVVTNNTTAASLANAIAGSGIAISNTVLTFDVPSPSGTFTGGLPSIGFDSGVVLTTGSTACVPGPNNSGGCSNGGISSSLAFDFESTSGQVFFQYVFGSEEYNFFVNTQFNDRFELRLNGTNIAQLPGGAGDVSINNVNCLTNAAFYRNNNNETSGDGGPPACANLNLDTELDGLTVVLTASATLQAGINRFEFTVYDRGDDSLDSAVFIKAGSFSAVDPNPNPNPVPEPGTLALAGIAMAGLAGMRRRKA